MVLTILGGIIVCLTINWLLGIVGAFLLLLVGETRLLFDHASAQDHFGCSVFWLRRLAAFGGEESAIGEWQIRRDGTERGIVEITSE
jgi:hypothetical protein